MSTAGTDGQKQTSFKHGPSSYAYTPIQNLGLPLTRSSNTGSTRPNLTQNLKNLGTKNCREMYSFSILQSRLVHQVTQGLAGRRRESSLSVFALPNAGGPRQP